MALPRAMRLKGYRTFNYIHKNSKKFYGSLITLKVARANREILISHRNFHNLDNLKIAISISKKVAKKSVDRNRIRRILQECLLKNFKECYNHKPYWLLVNLKSGYTCSNEKKLLQDFQHLILKTGLLND